MVYDCLEPTCDASFAREAYYIKHLKKHLNEGGTYLTKLKRSGGVRKKQRPVPPLLPLPQPTSKERREQKRIEQARAEWRDRQKQHAHHVKRKEKRWFKKLASAKVGSASSIRAEVVDLRSPSMSPTIRPYDIEDLENVIPVYHMFPQSDIRTPEREFALSPDTTLPASSRFPSPRLPVLATSASSHHRSTVPKSTVGSLSTHHGTHGVGPSTVSATGQVINCQGRSAILPPDRHVNETANTARHAMSSSIAAHGHRPNQSSAEAAFQSSFNPIVIDKPLNTSPTRTGPSWKTRTRTPSIVALEPEDNDELDSDARNEDGDDESSIVSSDSGITDLFHDSSAITPTPSPKHGRLVTSTGSHSVSPTLFSMSSSSTRLSMSGEDEVPTRTPSLHPHTANRSGKRDRVGCEGESEDEDGVLQSHFFQTANDKQDGGHAEDRKAQDGEEGVLTGLDDLESVNSEQWGKATTITPPPPFTPFTPRRSDGRGKVAVHSIESAYTTHSRHSMSSPSSSLGQVSASLGPRLSTISTPSFRSPYPKQRPLSANMTPPTHIRWPSEERSFLNATEQCLSCGAKERREKEVLALLAEGRIKEATELLRSMA